MDNFTDKLASKFNAQEMIKANAQAEANEMNRLKEQYINDVIIFSGKLSNMLANQFTPGLYGLKFGVQKSF